MRIQHCLGVGIGTRRREANLGFLASQQGQAGCTTEQAMELESENWGLCCAIVMRGWQLSASMKWNTPKYNTMMFLAATASKVGKIRQPLKRTARLETWLSSLSWRHLLWGRPVHQIICASSFLVRKHPDECISTAYRAAWTALGARVVTACWEAFWLQ